MPPPHAPQGGGTALAKPGTAPRVIRGTSGKEPELRPARAAVAVSIPTPEALGIVGPAQTAPKDTLAIPTPESLGVTLPRP